MTLLERFRLYSPRVPAGTELEYLGPGYEDVDDHIAGLMIAAQVAGVSQVDAIRVMFAFAHSCGVADAKSAQVEYASQRRRKRYFRGGQAGRA
jgi:hypothetical protein